MTMSPSNPLNTPPVSALPKPPNRAYESAPIPSETATTLGAPAPIPAPPSDARPPTDADTQAGRAAERARLAESAAEKARQDYDEAHPITPGMGIGDKIKIRQNRKIAGELAATPPPKPKI
jgi:hypothetical protein